MSAARIGAMANGRVSARPSSVSSASSIVPTWPKSCGRHSLMRDRFSTAIRRNGKRSASTPYGLMSAAASAASANVVHARAVKRRVPTGASVTASSANGPISTRPKMKPPCIFAQAVISAASPSGGARLRSRAARSAALQAAASGSASTWGRASRFAVTSERPIATVATSGAPRSSRAALSPTISAAVAAATPVKRTTPLHPPRRKASASRTSDSHSCAVQGAPGIEWLNGSARGAAPWAMIHSPVATCDQVSPSPST